MLTVFNKMDRYEEQTFDEWLEESTKKEILADLNERWQNETGGNAYLFQRLKKGILSCCASSILQKVREMYRVRYPYKTEFLY